MIKRLLKLANYLDSIGLYKEADELDQMASDMLDIIDDLEQSRKSMDKNRTNGDEDEKAGVGAIVDANGHLGTSVEQGAGWSGLSDAYFYRNPGSIEHNL